MYSVCTPTFASQLVTISGPSSLRIAFGTPRIENSSASVSVAYELVIPRPTFSTRRSRVNSSQIDSHFKAEPERVWSNVKSHVHTSFITSA